MRDSDDLVFNRRRVLELSAGVGAITLGNKIRARAVASEDRRGGGLQWTFDTDGLVRSSPSVVNGTVYVGSGSNHVYALDADSGSEEWVFETGSNVSSSPAVVDETVYVGSRDGNVYALEADSGDERWASETGSIEASSPTLDDDFVYIGSWDGTAHALEAATGREAWTYDTDGSIQRPSPTVVDGTVYIGSSDGNVYALDAASGEEEWTYEAEGDVRSSPTVAGDTVYVGSFDRVVYALDAASGDLEWTFETDGHIGASSPTVADETVYIGSYDDHIYALDASSGEEEWAVETTTTVESSPTVADGIVYVGNSSPRGAANVYAIDALRGHRVWTFDANGPVLSSPTVVDGTVYVGSYDNHVYALAAGVDGSSEGTRVSLGTLGHHDDVTRSEAPSPPTYDRSLLADFTVDRAEPTVTEPVEFDASASDAVDSDITSYRWDFTGDGETDRTGEHVQYEFDDAGTHQVTLTVIDETGAEDTVRQLITVDPAEREVTVEVVETNAPVEAGDSLEVTIEISNDGETAHRPELAFSVDGEERGTVSTTVDPGETTTYDRFSHRTYPVTEDDTVTVRVETDRDSAEQTVDVLGIDAVDEQYLRPARELTIQPETQCLFEIDGERVEQQIHWFVDGEYVTTPMGAWSSTYSNEVGWEYFSDPFESAGTYEVAAAVVTDDENAVARWDVTVTDDGAAPPAVDAARPVVSELATDDAYTLELALSSPDSDLDRVVWWMTQADAILDVSESSGSGDTVSIEIDGGCHTCRVQAWVIDETNAYTAISPWVFEGFDETGDETSDDDEVAVMIVDTSSPVTGGDPLEVGAMVENTSSEELTRTVEFVAGDEPETVATTTVSLAAGETDHVSFVYETYPVAQDDSFPVRLEIGGSSDSRTVYVDGTED